MLMEKQSKGGRKKNTRNGRKKKKSAFPHRESNPGRLGENQES